MILKKIILLLSAIVMTNIANAQGKLAAQQAAPDFSVTDLNGNSVRLADYKGRKVLLSFYRNTGCPVCNLRFHSLEKQAQNFEAKGLVVLAVYENSAEKLKEYTENTPYYTTFIPNPQQELYKQYGVEISMGKMMKGMFHGLMGKASQGKKLYKKSIKQEGNTFRMTADFLIDENGKIAKAHYAKYLGDELPVSEIETFINQK